MRIWRDPAGSLVDDQRLLAYLASFGSLSHALDHGDIVLVSDSDRGSCQASAASRPCARKRLADYLAEDTLNLP